jgi:3-deoxy-D-arabino-heptulosonate 7-phosphate (DAHP) synthase
VVSWVASLMVALTSVVGRVVVDVLGDHGRRNREEIGARIAVAVEAQVLLVVEGLGQADGDAAQRVLRQVERLAAEFQHPPRAPPVSTLSGSGETLLPVT